ncbi:hypothetical protein K501DRAFT_210995 [Backusella circina FSU 941]|nr:hypothetical protein K501DRAFT_210995 [Backusella circina FSU 941]
MIDGRRYQNVTKKYMLPNDEEEQDRLVQEHFIYKLIFGDNFSAPLRDLLSGSVTVSQPKRNSGGSTDNWSVESLPPPRILDVACGTGIWCLEMATEFPNGQFYGIDLSACYPSDIKPPNTFFSQCDILSEKGFPYPDGYFDYVFMRQVYNCFSESDWITIVKEINRVLKPGGYVEFRDVDPLPGSPGPYTQHCSQLYSEMMKKTKDVDITWCKQMSDYLQNHGDMTDMHCQVGTLQFGLKGAIGDTFRNAFRLALQSHQLFFEKECALKMSVHNYIDNIMSELVQHRSYLTYYQCWGRKSLFEMEKRISGPASMNNTLLSRKQSLANSIRFRRAPSSINEGTAGETGSPHSLKHADPLDMEKLRIILGRESVSDIDQFIQGFED